MCLKEKTGQRRVFDLGRYNTGQRTDEQVLHAACSRMRNLINKLDCQNEWDIEVQRGEQRVSFGLAGARALIKNGRDDEQADPTGVAGER